MSLWKKSRVSDVVHVEGRMETERYIYTPGPVGVKVAEALMEGRIMGVKCGNKLYIPAKTYCPDHSEGELVEVKGPWIVKSYTIIYEDVYGAKLDKPVVIALVGTEEAHGGLIHYVEVEPDKVKVGLKVEPVFRPKEERRGLITDVMFFKPVEHS